MVNVGGWGTITLATRLLAGIVVCSILLGDWAGQAPVWIAFPVVVGVVISVGALVAVVQARVWARWQRLRGERTPVGGARERGPVDSLGDWC